MRRPARAKNKIKIKIKSRMKTLAGFDHEKKKKKEKKTRLCRTGRSEERFNALDSLIIELHTQRRALTVAPSCLVL